MSCSQSHSRCNLWSTHSLQLVCSVIRVLDWRQPLQAFQLFTCSCLKWLMMTSLPTAKGMRCVPDLCQSSALQTVCALKCYNMYGNTAVCLGQTVVINIRYLLWNHPVHIFHNPRSLFSLFRYHLLQLLRSALVCFVMMLWKIYAW
jgi:hypothetical protein